VCSRGGRTLLKGLGVGAAEGRGGGGGGGGRGGMRGIGAWQEGRIQRGDRLGKIFAVCLERYKH